MFAGVKIPKGASTRMVPKHALTLEDLYFSLGSEKIVKQLRAVGALRGKVDGQTLLFDAAEVAKVWREYYNGVYDAQIKAL